MSMFEEALRGIRPVDAGLIEEARKRLDSLTKPRDSLGRLEEFARRMVAITGELRPCLDRKTIFTFAGDHGVADEGVSAFPKEVTRQMVYNFLGGGAGINALARHAGADVVVVDIGVDFEFDDAPGLVKRKVVRGTRNIRKGPAMTREEAVKCLEVGISLARDYAGKGAIFGTGEMGIANTTPASAIIAALSGLPPEAVTGRGTGIDDAIFRHKVKVIEDAIAVNSPDPSDPLDVLAKLGGAEIAGIAGLVIGAASKGVPVVVDGFISTAGALMARELEPVTAQYMFAAHRSVEKGHGAMLERMGMRPFVDLDLRLGEGTGAAIGITLIEAALRAYNEMATFGDAGVSEENA
ncbi:MAG: nicotinate-nucleotide--dimethylbenzimidazole phosphoribosyltransferase [Deltaproteobacteria bacterium]|nr:nicotinate-nucleotide--dimethylbenzimidazole phosphoribosyltransferase [Deltaproteobacteria bacterium]MCL4874463.1 nicotinate-nucleotide--dimethylbenzimidazole phosphoribosyltransferase [bacterium]